MGGEITPTSNRNDQDFSCTSSDGGPARRRGDHWGAGPDSHSDDAWGSAQLNGKPQDDDPRWIMGSRALQPVP
jgi:hypothetical protein